MVTIRQRHVVAWAMVIMMLAYTSCGQRLVKPKIVSRVSKDELVADEQQQPSSSQQQQQQTVEQEHEHFSFRELLKDNTGGIDKMLDSVSAELSHPYKPQPSAFDVVELEERMRVSKKKKTKKKKKKKKTRTNIRTKSRRKKKAKSPPRRHSKRRKTRRKSKRRAPSSSSSSSRKKKKKKTSSASPPPLRMQSWHKIGLPPFLRSAIPKATIRQSLALLLPGEGLAASSPRRNVKKGLTSLFTSGGLDDLMASGIMKYVPGGVIAQLPSIIDRAQTRRVAQMMKSVKMGYIQGTNKAQEDDRVEFKAMMKTPRKVVSSFKHLSRRGKSGTHGLGVRHLWLARARHDTAGIVKRTSTIHKRLKSIKRRVKSIQKIINSHQ